MLAGCRKGSRLADLMGVAGQNKGFRVNLDTLKAYIGKTQDYESCATL